jgi:hypothetical protein
MMTPHFNVLVDGGYSARTLISTLGNDAQLDVIVCTHNDKDHVGGFVDLLDKPGAPTVGEYWLPGRWADQIRDLVIEPEKFRGELETEIFGTLADSLLGAARQPADDSDQSDPAKMDEPALARIGPIAEPNAITDAIPIEDGNPNAQSAVSGGPFSLEDEGNLLQDLRARFVDVESFALIPGAPPLRAPPLLNRRFLNAIEAAERIRKIALQAIRHRVPIRWFDFQVFADGSAASGGWPGRLQPVNACEVKNPPTRWASRLEYLRLTKVNRESLVFYACERDGEPGALFCADSPLRGGSSLRTNWPGLTPTPKRLLVATAPHHGSASNSGAYAVVKCWVGERPIFWVRSGSAKRPCPELRQERLRYCTRCSQASRTACKVDFVAPGVTWWPMSCHCNC